MGTLRRQPARSSLSFIWVGNPFEGADSLTGCLSRPPAKLRPRLRYPYQRIRSTSIDSPGNSVCASSRPPAASIHAGEPASSSPARAFSTPTCYTLGCWSAPSPEAGPGRRGVGLRARRHRGGEEQHQGQVPDESKDQRQGQGQRRPGQIALAAPLHKKHSPGPRQPQGWSEGQSYTGRRMPSIEMGSGRLSRAAAWTEQHTGALCALLLAVVANLSLGHAVSRSLFYDEIATIYAAALPRWKDVWNFYAQGLDTPSPLSSLIVRPMLHLPGSLEVTARLPFLAAFLVCLYCMYRFLLKRYPAGYALAALLLPVQFDDLFFYSYEARVYSFVLAGVALALLCWQSAGERPRPATAFGLWAGLALAAFSHAFSILLFLPFAVAQWLRDREQASRHWAMWLALFLFPLGFLPTLPGSRHASAFYQAQFFVKPSFRLLPGLLQSNLGTQWLPFTLLLCTGLACPAYLCWTANRHAPGNTGRPVLPFPELVLLLLLAFLPLYGLLAALLFGVFREPYVLSFFIGFLLFVLALIAEASRRKPQVGLVLLGLMGLGLLTKPYLLGFPKQVFRHRSTHQNFLDELQHDPLLAPARHSTLPLVFNDHVLYSLFFEYSDPAFRTRMVYPINLAAVATYPKSSTSQMNFLRFGSLFGWHAPEWSAFAQQHPHFLLLRGVDPDFWLFPYLLARMQSHGDVSIHLLAASPVGEFELYDVTITPKPPPSAIALLPPPGRP